MKLQQLRHLLAVTDAGSLRGAARALGVAQPAITRSIRDLERELGATLFERKARGVVPTGMGEVFVRRARAVESELDRARDELAQLQGRAHGRVSVALSLVAHLALLPRVLRAFRERYPEVRLEVTEGLYSGIGPRLADGAIDCYIGPPPNPPQDGLLVEKLFDNTRVIVGRKGHPLAGAKSLRELAGADWLVTTVTQRTEDELLPLFEQKGLPPPRITMQSRSSMTALVSIAYTDVLAMLPVQWVESALLADAVQVIPVKEVIQAPPICIVQRSGLPLTPAAEHFCDLIRRAAVQWAGTRAARKTGEAGQGGRRKAGGGRGTG